MPETSVEIDSETYDWRKWVNEYINESKRLLTVRRKNVLLKHLSDFGATTLERKHGVMINLTAYELDMYPAEAKTVYATAHEELWIEFVEEAVERTDNRELMESPGLSKAEFAEKIRSLKQAACASLGASRPSDRFLRPFRSATSRMMRDPPQPRRPDSLVRQILALPTHKVSHDLRLSLHRLTRQPSRTDPANSR